MTADGGRPRRRPRGSWGSPAAACLLGLAVALSHVPASAQDGGGEGEPTVRFRAGGGDSIGVGLSGGPATAALPVTERFATQFDLDGSAGGDGISGGTGHVYWRDPEVGVVGVYGAYTEGQSVAAQRVGAQAEWFLDEVTVRGNVGQQFGDAGQGVVGDLDLRWYVTEDLATLAGASYVTTGTGDWLTRLGAEYRPGFYGMEDMTVFIDSTVGQDDYHTVLIGVSYTFSDFGSLIRRDRDLLSFGDSGGRQQGGAGAGGDSGALLFDTPAEEQPGLFLE